MVFNGIWFNEAWAKTKTEAEFISHESHHPLSKDQLKEVYALLNPKKRSVEKNPPVDTGAAGKTAE